MLEVKLLIGPTNGIIVKIGCVQVLFVDGNILAEDQITSWISMYRRNPEKATNKFRKEFNIIEAEPVLTKIHYGNNYGFGPVRPGTAFYNDKEK